MKKYILTLYSILFLSVFCYSQRIDKLDSYLFSIPDGKDTISFIKTNADQEKAKPTIVFCQGSLPIPLVVKNGDKMFFSNFNFDYKGLSEKYNLVIISSPHTPVVVDEKNLNPRSAYVSDVAKPYGYDPEYLKDNYQDKYVERATKVIRFLEQQPWVQKDKIYVMGHSQGANVAVKIANTNPSVSALGYFGGNPNGRIDHLIHQERLAAIQGKVSGEDAQENINRWYSRFKSFAKNEIPEGYQGDPPHTWVSFSTPVRDTLVNLTIPVFITYGTMDIAGIGCDALPIYFDMKGKTNYMLKPFVGLGHNFEEITADGKSNFENMKWQEAMDNFISWLENLSE